MSRPEVWNLRQRAGTTQPLALPELNQALCWTLEQAQTDVALETLYICLQGQLLLDLPYGDFVQLKAQEACRVAVGIPRTLTPVDRATVLLWRL